jgi:cytochrome c oxidase assembly protein subunit 15
MAAVQFDHRLLAWLLFVLVPAFWFAARSVRLRSRARLACNLMLLALGVQLTLGICTLLLAVPLPLAAAHQAGALLLFTSAIWVAHELR